MDCWAPPRSQKIRRVSRIEDGDMLEQCAKRHSAAQLSHPVSKNLTKPFCTDHLSGYIPSQCLRFNPDIELQTSLMLLHLLRINPSFTFIVKMCHVDSEDCGKIAYDNDERWAH